MKAATIDFEAIKQKAIRSNAFKNRALEILNEKVNEKKREFISEFENHPVTKEISSGASATNISGTLGGYGNLFSFIGFYSADNPVSVVTNLLNRIKLLQKIDIKKSGITANIYVPSLQDFGDQTKMPWQTGRSWLLDIEKTISGIGSYLYKKYDKSRSKTALQSNFDYSNKSFKSVKYFGEMYKKFISNLSR